VMITRMKAVNATTTGSDPLLIVVSLQNLRFANWPQNYERERARWVTSKSKQVWTLNSRVTADADLGHGERTKKC
jgi:hypothetical protein